jgi:ribosome recycling factor
VADDLTKEQRHKNMKNIHSSISAYKTTILRNMIRGLTKSVINKSCV